LEEGTHIFIGVTFVILTSLPVAFESLEVAIDNVLLDRNEMETWTIELGMKLPDTVLALIQLKAVE
jgi:hypothetical protein